MIRYALVCPGEHRFEVWFSDSASFDAQNSCNLIECPYCGSVDIRKQLTAPAVIGTRKSAKPASDGEDDKKFSQFVGKVRQHIEKNYAYVGKEFADTAIAMHHGEIAEKPVWGETTPEQADRMSDEGVPACPLPDAFAPLTPPDKTH